MLWHLLVFVLGADSQLGATSDCKRRVGGLVKTVEEEMGPKNLENGSVGYMVKHMEREESTYILRQG